MNVWRTVLILWPAVANKLTYGKRLIANQWSAVFSIHHSVSVYLAWNLNQGDIKKCTRYFLQLMMKEKKKEKRASTVE